MNALKPHPVQRFSAPSAIEHGVPLKDLMDRRLVTLIGESLSDVVPGFDVKRFQTRAVTQRFTAEFSIRPFLIEYRSKCLKMLARWTKNSSPHVRRLVSEGTRPRLP